MYSTFCCTLLLLSASLLLSGQTDSAILEYTVDPRKQDLRFFLKNNTGERLGDFEALQHYLAAQGQTLVFATNGGMFKPDFTPVGLYIEAGKLVSPLDTSSGNGNFYLKPNGIFYLTRDRQAGICKTEDFVPSDQIQYATQSGPMLVINGQLHPAFRKGSPNVHIRNGVGIRPDGTLLFAMSKQRINLYDFAGFFQQAGCVQALYLDGFVSRCYLPEQGWRQLEGDLGILIGVVR